MSDPVVEWPDGWEKDDGGFAFHAGTNVAFRKKDLIEILETGPAMLALWDKLMGGEK